MAEREVKIGVASYVAASSSAKEPFWGFGTFGQKVDVHESDLERFDRLNGPVAADPVPLPSDPEHDPEPPRSGKGSGVDAWTEYASGLGIEVPEGASRDDVIALVDDSKK